MLNDAPGFHDPDWPDTSPGEQEAALAALRTRLPTAAEAEQRRRADDDRAGYRAARDGQPRNPAKDADWLAGYDRAAAETVIQIILAFREGGRAPASAEPLKVSPAARITARLIDAAWKVGRRYGAKEKSGAA